ncbi:hypothetical protein AYI69_g6557 [Smittium culicis]|uniref:Uncharacterized protein n=1 Tax=Smittium culicis TaxID=133412 RepID=A0A1R1XXS0_9FUNG|nr:hypothetical protein AYI69_g6631 [Smittium culicis]OMJ19611.1 hypothetical protein AYI69_g6557 [Smittium culicis]
MAASFSSVYTSISEVSVSVEPWTHALYLLDRHLQHYCDYFLRQISSVVANLLESAFDHPSGPALKKYFFGSPRNSYW